MKWWVIAIILFLVFFFFLLGPLLTYFFAKRIAIWFKRVKRIDNRSDLAKYPKLEKIVNTIRLICQNYEIPMPEVGLYPSREINAFATGRSSDTLVALSTGLVKKFSEPEIKGVLAHEVSHLLHRDLAFILLIQGICDLVVILLSQIVFYLALFSQRKEEEKKSLTNQIVWFIFANLVYQLVTIILRLISVIIVCLATRQRELKADRQAARIVGFDLMILSLEKLLTLERQEELLEDFLPTKPSSEDNLDFNPADQQANDYQQEPNSISLLKLSSGKKRSDWLLNLFRTHPPLEERIRRLKRLKKRSDF